MSKKYFLIEMDVPATISVKYICMDLKSFAQDLTDSSEQFGSKKLTRARAKRLTKAQVEKLK